MSANPIVTVTCSCGAEVAAPTDDEIPAAFLVHVRAEHDDWPFPDTAVEVVGEALLRLTGPAERAGEDLDAASADVVPVMPDHLGDWLAFFDHDAFVDRPWLAACYCLEQHAPMPPPAVGGWRDNREQMRRRFEDGTAFGYLALVDGRTAAWVNAALRRDQIYALARDDDATTVTVSCFNVGPAHRGQGLKARLLDRVVADAPGRGATRVEAYPRTELGPDGSGRFRGSLELYESRGFVVVKDLGWGRLVRLSLSSTPARAQSTIAG
jgi:GNAT superfamily N-acetyltransferase